MKKFSYYILLAGLTISMLACNKSETKTSEKAPSVDSATAVQMPAPEPAVASKTLKGDYCFQSAINRDTTTIRVRVLSDDDIRGEMIWNPWQKDGAVGTLSGKMISKNEMKLIYDYTIEGNRQSEEKVFKIESEKLFIKKGELTDPKKDGHVVFKDFSKATYNDTEVINKTSCN